MSGFIIAQFSVAVEIQQCTIQLSCAYCCSWMTSWRTIEQHWMTPFRCYRVVSAEVYIPRVLSSYISLFNLRQFYLIIGIHDCQPAVCVSRRLVKFHVNDCHSALNRKLYQTKIMQAFIRNRQRSRKAEQITWNKLHKLQTRTLRFLVVLYSLQIRSTGDRFIIIKCVWTGLLTVGLLSLF